MIRKTIAGLTAAAALAAPLALAAPAVDGRPSRPSPTSCSATSSNTASRPLDTNWYDFDIVDRRRCCSTRIWTSDI